ncbi:MAG: hypothetical protein A3D39_00095 [Candidatus Buchananbacteria bacterium RIFCSPHIGHO2_02_FULL_39_17]|uniref:Uncharacterized protein n=1 Tax=Candidatus Buchananbacteria bacterium RIFCSPLOWO2_01_FULL_40_23b TaxID=1797544 RepID=A0A1G1YTV2_9BACT|nr:MAG: hypothetical protein A3D39_00095 [Candidatus Buchananbacteria bacterium RIFCSPHIGHO2_02_FULL_39_17]OGY55785.1 MAG: hypothetical protein A2912_01005 [Candidatus Buchananbacteria bacterium RIFCSPLOWO2_01_FULL_40_23b]
MLDAFIIDEIQKRKIADQEKGRRQPGLYVPDMPYIPPERERSGREAPQRGYWDNEREDSSGDGCVIIDMKSLRPERYIV